MSGLRRTIAANRTAWGVSLHVKGGRVAALGEGAELHPPRPANSVGLGSPAVSATATPPFPWETANDPTPTLFPHPERSKENPLGIGGHRLHEWVFPLAAWRAMHGLEGGEINESNRVVEESLANIGATIMGRNMFGGHHSRSRAATASRGKDVSLAGGAKAAQQYLNVGLVDEMEISRTVAAPDVTHLKFVRG